MQVPTSSNKKRSRYAEVSLIIALIVFFATFLLVEIASPNAAFLTVPLHSWCLLARSAAEAGIIGGLVDWFAVVAIFEHPFGWKIRHTAVIPNSKDKIADGIYAFVTKTLAAKKEQENMYKTNNQVK